MKRVILFIFLPLTLRCLQNREGMVGGQRLEDRKKELALYSRPFFTSIPAASRLLQLLLARTVTEGSSIKYLLW